jgi:hypothetical protein
MYVAVKHIQRAVQAIKRGHTWLPPFCLLTRAQIEIDHSTIGRAWATLAHAPTSRRWPSCVRATNSRICALNLISLIA